LNLDGDPGGVKLGGDSGGVKKSDEFFGEVCDAFSTKTVGPLVCAFWEILDPTVILVGDLRRQER